MNSLMIWLSLYKPVSILEVLVLPQVTMHGHELTAKIIQRQHVKKCVYCDSFLVCRTQF